MEKSSFSQFISGTLFTGAGKFMVLVMGILGLSITARVIDPTDVGTFFLLLAIVIFLSEVSALGLNFALPKFLPGIENDDEHRVTINTILYFRLFTIALVGTFAFVIAQPLFSLFGAQDIIAEVLIYVPFMVGLESIGKLLQAILQGQFRFKQIGLVNTISSIVNFTSILIFVLFLQYFHALFI